MGERKKKGRENETNLLRLKDSLLALGHRLARVLDGSNLEPTDKVDKGADRFDYTRHA
jgi:hypothetical protein